MLLSDLDRQDLASRNRFPEAIDYGEESDRCGDEIGKKSRSSSLVPEQEGSAAAPGVVIYARQRKGTEWTNQSDQRRTELVLATCETSR